MSRKCSFFNLVKNIQVKQLKVAVLETITGDDAKTWYKIMLDDGSIGYARYDFFGDPIYEDISQSLEKSQPKGLDLAKV